MDPRDSRGIETALARFTLGTLVVYFPLETWVSLPYGLWHPMYLVDFAAMVLLFWGARHSLRSRPRCAPGLLCGAWGWAAANGWRATFWRWIETGVEGSAALDHGSVELWAVTLATAVALACFGLSLVLARR